MSNQYEFPDDPEVFERVLEHFRNTSVAYWEARMAHYAREARIGSPTQGQASVASDGAKKQEKIKGAKPHAKPTKRLRSASGT